MSDRTDYLRSILAAPLPETLEQRAVGEKPCQWSEIDRVISAFMGGHISRDDILRDDGVPARPGSSSGSARGGALGWIVAPVAQRCWDRSRPLCLWSLVGRDMRIQRYRRGGSMANPLLRTNILELLADGDMTAAAIVDELGALRNSVDKALVRAREEREIHVCGYAARTAAIYRHGPGVDAPRPAALDPVAPADERHDVKVRDVRMPGYFELDGGLLPGVRHFACDRYKATLSVESCAGKFKQANSGDAFGRHAHCRLCPIGAAHAGAGPDLNLGTLKGSLICSRCHRLNGRLIAKRLCISCQNRQYESIKKRNAKGSAPIKLPPLHRLTIGYMAGGKVRTHTVERAVDTTELIVDVLRDSEHSPSFGWLADPATRALRDNPDLDFSISDDVDEVVAVADVAAIADNVHGVQERAVVPIAASPPADVAVDSLHALRDAVKQLKRDAPACAPRASQRAAKKLAGRRGATSACPT